MSKRQTQTNIDIEKPKESRKNEYIHIDLTKRIQIEREMNSPLFQRAQRIVLEKINNLSNNESSKKPG